MTHHLVGMAEIAEMLGVTRQRVAQLIESYEDFPKPEVELSGGRVWSRTAIETWIASHPQRGPGRRDEGAQREGRPFETAGLFSRFTDRARQSVVKAQEEARLLKHNYIGTEHLLLGLIAIEDGLAWQALTSMGVSLKAAREGVRTMIGEGTQQPQGHIPFTPRAKKVLELSLRESKAFGHNYIGTEHVLLALFRETDGVAWKVVEDLGLKQPYARSTVISAMQGLKLGGGWPTTPAVRDTSDESTDRCSFCGKRREDAKKLVAGPGVSICDECVALAAGIVAEEVQAPPDPDPRATRLSDVVMDEIARKGADADLAARVAEFEERLRKLEERPDA